MSSLSRRTVTALAAMLAFGTAAVPAAAQDTPPAPAAPFGSDAISDASLQSVAGREDTQQVSFANQTAGVSNNSIGDNARTGDARIEGNAFQNLSGLSILNVNTGNNVAINAAMNVNIAIAPAP